jgi:5-methylcytosine-specific restriction endonuclease McrA
LKKLPGTRVKLNEENAYLAVCHRTIRNRPDVVKILQRHHFFDAAKRKSTTNKWNSLRDKVWKGKHGEITGASIMSALRDHLADVQQENCCYCGQALLLGGYSRQLDHVLPSSVYGRFSFHFWNLAVACERCNRIKKAKGFQPVSRNFKHYPEHIVFSDYFHPRFHPYKAHVRFGVTATQDYSYIFYAGQTKQGRQLVSDVLQAVALEMTRESNDPAIKTAAAAIRAAIETQGSAARSAMRRFQQAIRVAVEAGAV